MEGSGGRGRKEQVMSRTDVKVGERKTNKSFLFFLFYFDFYILRTVKVRR